MFGLGLPELAIILVIVLILFGPKRLKNIGSDLGNAIKGFRTAVTEDADNQASSPAQEKVIDAEANPQDANQAQPETQQQTKV